MLCRMQLNSDDAAGMAGMTLWDILSGKYQSRVPCMNSLNEQVAAPRWAAWDPCSKHRSRCVFTPARNRTNLNLAPQVTTISKCRIMLHPVRQTQSSVIVFV
jgi:hypothetical protein